MIKKRCCFRKILHIPVLSGIVLFSSLSLPSSLLAADKKPQQEQDGYTINFENVSIKEFIKFISKISKTNFIYNEDELNFNVTIISEDETSLSNVMSALVQVLRIHDLMLIEEDQNFLIYKNSSVKQIPVVIGEDTSFEGERKPAMATKVFQIQSGEPARFAALITPLLSNQALVEVSTETRQLIITDTYASLEGVADLLRQIDIVGAPFEMQAFEVQNLEASSLTTVAKEVTKLFAGDTPLLMIPQIQTNIIYVISTPPTVKKTIDILSDLDRPPLSIFKAKHIDASNVLSYVIKRGKKAEILKTLSQIIQESSNQGFDSEMLEEMVQKAKYIPQTHSLMFIGPAKDIAILHQLLSQIDQAGAEQAKLTHTAFYLFDTESIPLEELENVLDEIQDHFENEDLAHPHLIEAIKSAKPLPQINAILFIADTKTISELKSLLESIQRSYDHEMQLSGPMRFLIYPIREAHEEQIRKSLHQLADSLESNDYTDDSLIQAIDSMQWLKSTNALVFTGHEKALEELQTLLPTFDVSPENSKSPLNQSTQFIAFHPTKATAAYVVRSLHDLGKSLQESKLDDPNLITSLLNAHGVESSNQVVVTGTAKTLEKVSHILQNLDQEHSSHIHAANTFTIPINHADKALIENSLDEYANSLPKGDSAREMIETMHWLPDSAMLVFHGPKSSMDQINKVIERVDTMANTSPTTSFALVKLQNASGEYVIKELRQTAKRLAAEKQTSTGLVDTLDGAHWNPNSNTIMLTGSKANIEKAKELITTFDVPSKTGEVPTTELVKLQYITPEEAKALLLGIADHATSQEGQTEFSKSLTKTINSIRVIPNTDAIQFVGPPTVNKKVEEWLKTLDNPDNAHAKIQHSKGSSFFIYHPKSASAKDLLARLSLIAQDLESNMPKNAQPPPLGSEDLAVAQTIKKARIIQESDSIIFSGPPQALEKIRNMLSHLDVGTKKEIPTTRPTPEGYQLYSPKHVPGSELISYVQHFEQHLIATGVREPELSETIDHLTYLQKTNTIIVSGDKNAIQRVLALLEQFDVANSGGPVTADDIEMIDDIGFLNYKIQYHNGSDIVESLRSIGLDLKTGKDDKNQPLMDAIQSVQWIEVTNSLIATGQPKVLTKLRELIEGIDIPLKQVFIEVLVIETNIDNMLDFGLRWSSQGKFKDQFAWGGGNNPSVADGISFSDNVNKITGIRSPSGTDIDPINSGYLGVIGDIITHNGNAYAALGSLLTALKTDGDITVVLNQKIITQDNRNSKIFVGDNVPFTGSLVTTAGLSQTTNANLEYRNIGVTLSITPFVGNNGVITLDIDEEISEESNTGTDSGGDSSSTQSVNGIRTSKTSMQTRVHVPDRHFLVLSGMIRNSTTRKKTGIPCLGGLPVIGAAFSETSKLVEKKNVVIFVKPHIIDSPQTYDKITQRQEEIFGTNEQCNQEDFQAGIELVRSPDDEEYRE